MNEELESQLCSYLGELDYLIDNSNDYFDKINIEKKREAVHTLLGIKYKSKVKNITDLVNKL